MLVLCATLATLVQQPDTLQRQLTAKLATYVTTSGFPGAVVGIRLKDGRILTAAAGLSDSAKKEPMTTDHLLLMGSVGKTYVAAVAMQLVKEGKLDLEAKASKYVGGQGWFDSLPNAAAITVRNLMQHTSGLIRYEFKPEFLQTLTANPDRVWDPRDQVRYLHGTAAPFAPGTGWDYSDTNYLVVALILEKIVGRPIDEEISRRFLVPLKLVHTIPSDARKLPGVSQGYAGPRNEFGGKDAVLTNGVMIINPQFEGAGGGYAATAAEGARWAALYFSGEIHGDALLKEATTGVPAAMLGRGARYGLGIIMNDSTAAGPVRYHSGFFPGYQTEMRYYPATGTSAILMINSSNARPRPAMGRWVDETVAALLASVGQKP